MARISPVRLSKRAAYYRTDMMIADILLWLN